MGKVIPQIFIRQHKIVIKYKKLQIGLENITFGLKKLK